jgi:hypothetical protein
LSTTFLIAGVLPVVFAVAAVVLARMPADELANPLDEEPAEAGADPAAEDVRTG